MLNNAKHKTRLTQKKKKKKNTHTHTSNATNKNKKIEESDKSLRVLFLPHLGRIFPLIKPLNRWRGGRIETVQVQKEHEGLKKITEKSER